MKHPTIRSINAALPHFEDVRRSYHLLRDTGFVNGQAFSSAFADLDDNGDVESITLYAVGDGMEPAHYYHRAGTACITDCIESILSREVDGTWYGYGEGKRLRQAICRTIQEYISTMYAPRSEEEDAAEKEAKKAEYKAYLAAEEKRDAMLADLTSAERAALSELETEEMQRYYGRGLADAIARIRSAGKPKEA